MAGVALGGCGGGARDARRLPSPPASRTSATASPAATPTEATPEAAALAAYRGMWEDWVAIAATSDYQNPRLTRHVSGRALSTIYRAVAADRHRGLVSHGTPTFSPRVSAFSPSDDPTRVTIDDCADASTWLHYDNASGKLEDDVPGGRHRVQALALRTAGVWKVDELVIQPVGTC
ncbi:MULTISPECIES: hypothetical protein [Frankia]|uniref:hypothetical protein n=1 Tax=Frankia TaxID=1854 RepID=UPI001F5B8885|nr:MULTISPECIES: hypothetical protein [Frankia]